MYRILSLIWLLVIKALQVYIQPAIKVITTKNDKSLAMFSVKVEAESTFVDAPEEFEVLPLDIPAEIYEYEFELDNPPVKVNN